MKKATFEEFLKQHKLVPSKYVKYYRHWVQSLVQFCGHSLKDLITWENQTGFY